MTVFGPFHVSEVNGSATTKTRVVRKERYKTNGREVAPYMVITSNASIPGRWVSDMDYIASSELFGGGSSERMYDRAYDNFMGKVRGGPDKAVASLGVAFAEIGSSRAMAMKRLRDVVLLTRAIRERNFANFLYAMGMEAPKSARDHWRRRRGEAIEDNLLEYRFGWVPIFQDIYAVQQQLGREFPTSRVSGTNFQTKVLTNSGTYKWNVAGRLAVRISADVVVSNPNVALLNSLGLLNPGVIAWDLVPFSFLIEGFVPLGKFLGSFSNECGFTLTNRTVSYQCSAVGTFQPNPTQLGHADSRFYRRRVVSDFAIPPLRRRIRIPGVDLSYGVTLTALAVQQWKSFKSSFR